MAVKVSGQLTFTEIGEEFGLAPNPNGSGYSLGAYRVSQTVSTLANLGLDNNQNNPPTSIMPQGNSTIKFSDFYSKRLNTVVDLHSSNQNNTTRKDIRSRYNSNNVTVIGGFRSKPTDTGEKPPTGIRGKRVIGLVNVTIGSERSSTKSRCAVQTGTWDSNTTFEVHIGSSGRIIGAGGNGGNGGTGCSGNTPGAGNNAPNNATSGLGIEQSGTRVINNGYIQCGYGGGGGGGHASCDPDKSTDDPIAPGGGGGGGAGYPFGQGGTGNCDSGGCGDNGGTSSYTSRGTGGAGNVDGCATGGTGGNGGQPGSAPQNGGDANQTYGPSCEKVGGNAGYSGDAIRSTVSSGNVTLVNAGTIHGGQVYSTSVS